MSCGRINAKDHRMTMDEFCGARFSRGWNIISEEDAD